MRSYPFLAASFILSSPLSVDAIINHQPGTFFSSADLKMLQAHIQRDEDVIVLRDGTQLKGTIHKLPQLKFKYGSFPLEIEDVSYAAISWKGGKPKIQVVNQDGSVYIFDLPAQRIGLNQHLPSHMHSTHTLSQEIEPLAISHIILHQRKDGQMQPRNHVALELKNGDQIPVSIIDQEVLISNGWNEYPLRTNDLLDITYDGGIFGRIRDEKGNEKEIGTVLVSGKELTLKLLHGMQRFKVSWDEIARLKAENSEVSPGQGIHENKSSQAMQREPISMGTTIQEKLQEPSKKLEHQRDEAFSKDIELQVRETANEIQVESLQGAEKWKELSQVLSRENQELKFKISALDQARKEFLLEQESLVANLEFEFTRTFILRRALSDLMERWSTLKNYNQSLIEKLQSMKHGGIKEPKKGEIAQVVKELQRLKDALIEQTQLTAEFDNTLATLKSQINEDKENHSETNSTLEEYLAKANTYKCQLESVTNAFDQFKEEEHKPLVLASQEADRLRHELNEERQLMESLTQAWEEEKEKIAREHEGELKKLSQKLEVKAKEIEELKHSKEELHTKLVTQINQLTEEREKQDSYQMELDSLIQKLLGSVEEEKGHVFFLESELENISREKELLRDQYRQYQLEMARRWDEVEEIHAVQQSMQRSLTKEAEELAEVNQWISREKRSLEEVLQQLENALSRQNQERNSLVNELQQMMLEVQEQRDVSELYQGMSQKLNEEKAQLISCRESNEAYLAELEALVQKMLVDSEEEKKNARELESQHLITVKRVIREEKAALQDKIDELQANMNDESFHNGLLRLELSEVRKDAECYMGLVHELEEAVQELRLTIESGEHEKAKREEEFSNRECVLTGQVKALTEKLEYAHAHQTKLEDTLKEVDRDKQTLEMQKCRSRQEMEEMLGVLTALQGEMDTLKREVLEREEEFAEKECALHTEIQALKEKIQQSLVQHEKLEDGLKQAEHERYTFEMQKLHFRQELEEMLGVLEARENEIKEVKQEFLEKEERFSQKEEQLEAELQGLKEKIQQSTMHQVKLEDALKQADQERDALEMQKLHSRQEIEEMFGALEVREKELEAHRLEALGKEEEFSQKERAFVAEVQSLEEKLHQAEAYHAELEEALKQADQERYAFEMHKSQAHKEMKEMLKVLSAREKEMEGYKLEALGREEIFSQNERALEREIHALKEKIQQADAYRAELEDTLKGTGQERDAFEAKQLHVRQEMKEILDLLASREKEMEDLKQEALIREEEISQKESTLEREVLALNEQIQQARVYQSRLEETLKGSDLDRHAFEIQRRQFQVELREMGEALAILEKENDDSKQKAFVREEELLQKEYALKEEVRVLNERIQEIYAYQDKLEKALEGADQERRRFEIQQLRFQGSMEEMFGTLRMREKEMEDFKQEALIREEEISQKEREFAGEIQALAEKVRKSHMYQVQLEDALKTAVQDKQKLEMQTLRSEREMEGILEVLSQREKEMDALNQQFLTKENESREFGENTTIQLVNLTEKLNALFQEREEKERLSEQLAADLKISEKRNQELQKEMILLVDRMEDQDRKSSCKLEEISTVLDGLKLELSDEKVKNLSLANDLEQIEIALYQAYQLKESLNLELKEAESKFLDASAELTRQQYSFLEQNRERQRIENAYQWDRQNLADQLEQMKAALDGRDDHIQNLEGEKTQLSQAKERIQASLLTERMKLAQTEELISRMQKELNASNVSLAAKQDEVDGISLSFESLNRDSAALHAALLKQYHEEHELAESLKTHLASLIPKFEAEKGKIFHIETELEKANSELILAKNAFGKSEQQLLDAKEKLSAMYRENQKLAQERDSYLLQLQKDKEEIAGQKEVVKRLTDSWNSQKAALNKIEKSHLNLASELENARNQQSLILKEIPQEIPRAQISSHTASQRPQSRASNQGLRDIHIVADGENLNNISMKYYGTPYRWSDIFEANEGIIQDVNRIKVGTALVIPE